MNENQIQTLLQALRTLQDLGKVAYFNKGAYNSETTYEINDVVSYNGSSYVSLGNDNLGNLPTNTAFWSLVASKGDKGDTGKAFVIEKTYASIEDMVADYDNMNINDYVMIQGSIEDEENATLWVKTETEVSPYKWVYLADFSGASGITGATPNIQIGTVTEGNQPSVTRRAGSTNENPILDFVLKTGAKGDTGATGNGISGVAKTSTSGLTDTYTISYTSGNSSTFDVHNGKGISSIAKTTSVGLVDTYTITYNDGTTSTFDITNGQDGEVTQEQLDETNAEVSRVNMVYNALPKVSGEGTDLTLDGTAECPVYEVDLRPSELEQETTTGKNLLPNDVSSQTINGITVKVNNDKSISLSGTATNNIYLYLAGTASTYPLSLTAGTYTLNSNSNTNNVWIRLVDSSSNIYDSVQSATTITLENTTTFNSYIRINNGASINVTLYPQLESGSTATTYEEYTGGQPSPSPEYPQEIRVVSGDNSVVISNKNLFDKDNANIINAYINNKLLNSNDSARTLYISAKPNTTYTVSKSVGNRFSVMTSEAIPAIGVTGTNGIENNTASSITITTGANDKYIAVYFYLSTADTLTPQEIINTIQIEEGSTASSFEPHKEQTYLLPLGDLEYCKIGDYEDLFFKNVVGNPNYDSTLQVGKWYLKKNVGKVVFDGTESWSIQQEMSGLFQLGNNRIPYSSLLGISDYFINNPEPLITNNTTANTYLENYQFAFRWGTNLDRIYIKFTEFGLDVNAFKDWLSAHNTILYYVALNPTYTLLNNTLQTQLDNIQKAISYQGQTNVSQVNDDLPFVIKLSAIRDMSGIFDLISQSEEI